MVNCIAIREALFKSRRMHTYSRITYSNSLFIEAVVVLSVLWHHLVGFLFVTCKVKVISFELLCLVILLVLDGYKDVNYYGHPNIASTNTSNKQILEKYNVMQVTCQVKFTVTCRKL